MLSNPIGDFSLTDKVALKFFFLSFQLLSVTKKWSAKDLTTGGARPSYGHSSVYDPQTGCIYVHGGYRMYNRTYHAPSSDTFCYHPKNNKWSALNSSGVPRYLHSAVLVDNAMIVYGGRGIHGYSPHPLLVFDIGKYSMYMGIAQDLSLFFLSLVHT